MKTFNRIFLLLIVTLLFSCSSDDADVDPIIGDWAGDIRQDSLGIVTVNLSLVTLEVGNTSNRISGEFNDISECDNTVFFCDEILGTSCASTWAFTSRTGGTYNFDEVVLPGNDCTNGSITATVSGDQLNYSFVAVNDPSNVSSGTLIRQQ